MDLRDRSLVIWNENISAPSGRVLLSVNSHSLNWRPFWVSRFTKIMVLWGQVPWGPTTTTANRCNDPSYTLTPLGTLLERVLPFHSRRPIVDVLGCPLVVLPGRVTVFCTSSSHRLSRASSPGHLFRSSSLACRVPQGNYIKITFLVIC